MTKRAKKAKAVKKAAKKKLPKKPAAKARAKAKPARKAVKKAAAKPKASKPAAPAFVRQFRYTAADTVQIRFKGEKKPESFRVDDMSEASLTAQDGTSRHYYQFKLVSNDRPNADGSDRAFWFFDPRPVGADDPLYPLLWQPISDDVLAGEPVASHSGNFSTRSVTGYDGSGAVHVVKDDGTHRMRFDFNGKRYLCESLVVSIGKGDSLSAS
ncbi:MAG: hypothetical protein AB1490_02760 [Pseudomonadota bacterium]